MKSSLKVILPIAVLAGAALLVVLMIRTRARVTPEPREIPVSIVRTITIQPQPHHFRVHATGIVIPQTEIQLVARVTGRIETVLPSFAAGGFFNEGDTLIRIEKRDYELAVIRARAALAEAEVRVQREQGEAEVARAEWESIGQGAPNPLVLREPQLAEARAAAESARAALQQAELDLARCDIKAPFNGRVWEKSADAGQFVPAGTRLGRIYAVDYAEVRLPLPLEDVALLDLPFNYRGETQPGRGPIAILRAEFGNQRHEWTGYIVRTEGEIDSRTRMLTAVARVDDPYSRGSDQQRPPLSVGLFVEAEIQGRSAGNVFLVPRAAIRGKDQAMIVDDENRLRFRPVEILRRERHQIVVSQGLRPGEQLCVSPLDAAVDGMTVRPTPADGAPAHSAPAEAQ